MKNDKTYMREYQRMRRARLKNPPVEKLKAEIAYAPIKKQYDSWYKHALLRNPTAMRRYNAFINNRSYLF